MTTSNYCLHCCQLRNRPSGCEECGADAPGIEPAKNAQSLSPGTLLGDHYLLGRTLGSGGFGITYLAVDVNLDMRVAIKEHLPRDIAMRSTDGCSVVANSTGEEEGFRYGLEKFLGEGKSLARFRNHPNIVSVVNFFEANGTGYLVMEYLEGMDLEGYRLSCGGRVAEADAVNVIIAVLDGLRAVHAGGMLHRDIKPQNVILTDSGQIKLIDFGAARFEAVQKSQSLTQIWTPGYAPFEQCYSGGKQGPWTDIYGAGATLYRLLTGAELPESAVIYTGDAVLASPRELVGNAVSEAVSDVVMKAMAPRGADRYQSVKVFLEALQGATNGQQVEPPPPPPKNPEPNAPHSRNGGDRQAKESASDRQPPESDLLDGFRDNGDGTITDTITGLVWQQGDSGEMLAWEDAKNYAAELELGGFSDWRLPDKTELTRLYCRLAKLANGKDKRYVAPFCWWSTFEYWSSSTYAYDTSSAWYVDFDDGSADQEDKDGGTYTRCVRSLPKSPPESDLLDGFRDNGDGTITDNMTGLTWQQGDSNQRLRWEDAKTYGAGLVLGGFSDWRLPNKTELKHLYDRLAKLANDKDDRRVAPFRWTGFRFFGGGVYWSSSSYANFTNLAWGVNFSYGYVSSYSKTGGNYARCVRP